MNKRLTFVYVLFNGMVYKMPKEVTNSYKDYLEGRVISTSPGWWVGNMATCAATYLRNKINKDIQGVFKFCDKKGTPHDETEYSVRRYWSGEQP